MENLNKTKLYVICYACKHVMLWALEVSKLFQQR